MTIKYKDWTNRVFGRLTVISLHHKIQKYKPDGSPNGHRYYWECQCSCGNRIVVLVDHLTRHKIRSCGCLQRERASLANKKHGKQSTRIYRIWCGMRRRCSDANLHNYERYGGRGIDVCEDWKEDFLNFYNWAINNGYEDSLSLDRIDVDGNYEPNNCRWATNKDQARNMRTNRNFTYKGETHCISEWAEIIGIKAGTLRFRLVEAGWSIKEALETPVGYRRK